MASPKKVILWSAPRCVSTAFERSIRTLDQVQVFHELCAIPYHCGVTRNSDLFTEIPLDPSATFKEVSDILTKPYDDKQLIFAKEMAMCLMKNYDVLQQDKMKEFQHTFLIRHPVLVAKSLLRCGYFVAKEFGIKELYELYNFVSENLHPSPLVIDAEDLLTSPDEVMRTYCEAIGVTYQPEMTKWQPGPVPGWDRHVCAGWHDAVMESNGFVKRSRDTEEPSTSGLSNDVIEVIEECMPMYEALYSKKINIQ